MASDVSDLLTLHSTCATTQKIRLSTVFSVEGTYSLFPFGVSFVLTMSPFLNVGSKTSVFRYNTVEKQACHASSEWESFPFTASMAIIPTPYCRPNTTEKTTGNSKLIFRPTPSTKVYFEIGMDLVANGDIILTF